MYTRIKEFYSRSVIFVESKPYLRTLLVFSFFFLLFLAIYLPNSVLVSSDDHFFHFRFAELLRQNGFFETFHNVKALYFSHAAQDGSYYLYYNFFFYLCIIPFTYFSPLYFGIKLYAIIAAALTFTGIYAVLRAFRVSYAFGWVIALFSLAGTDIVWRLLLSRPYVLAPMLLIAMLVCLYEKRWIAAGVISFLYLFWYDATFFFPFGIALLYAVLDKLYGDRWHLRGLLSVTIGSLLAVASVYALAPGFFLFMHDIVFGAVATIGGHVPLPEGTELYPIDIFSYIRTNTLLFAALIMGLFADGYLYVLLRKERGTPSQNQHGLLSIRATLLFVVFGLLACAMLITGRFKDYLFPFLGIYVILAVSDLASRIRFEEQAFMRVMKIAFIVVLVYLCASSTLALDTFIADNAAPVETFQGVGGWLTKHTNPGDVIFNADWGWFPQLYYYSPYDNYVIGLEPRFLYAYSPHLFWLWMNVTKDGVVCDTQDCVAITDERDKALKNSATSDAWYASEAQQIADVVKKEFKSSYIVSSYQYTNLNAVLDHSDRFERVYGKTTYYIYRVK